MSEPPLETFPSRPQLDAALAGAVAERLTAAIAARGRALLVVSGGATPLGLFRELAARELPWDRVQITLADERQVPADHQDSNEKLVREKLLIKRAARAAFIPLQRGGATAAANALAAEPVLAQLGTFDVVLLGMGADGHTASLFPGAKALARGLDRDSGRHCIPLEPPAAPHPRIILTLPRLLDARQIFVHITGSDKLRVLEQARQTADQRRFPIAAVLCQGRTPVTIYWGE